ncbi:hypothetical protein G7K_2059-t1 [Saitoella complicata NRRL Y-17804]|uniref:Uncharacterized protein n=1 Tax=Saitoella complicata (strain BCRC 22490 / CBS 7301 / JCM 7358 / NBRC 10748 / NRRL Y-17804) TaxID=698492 RepID=A0A0E9NDI5_SAICN|nr:hypothetical protein G7K_2059-t1 [Saitoella complicata NRRL Y-17804]
MASDFYVTSVSNPSLRIYVEETGRPSDPSSVDTNASLKVEVRWAVNVSALEASSHGTSASPNPWKYGLEDYTAVLSLLKEHGTQPHQRSCGEDEVETVEKRGSECGASIETDQEDAQFSSFGSGVTTPTRSASFISLRDAVHSVPGDWAQEKGLLKESLESLQTKMEIKENKKSCHFFSVALMESVRDTSELEHKIDCLEKHHVLLTQLNNNDDVNDGMNVIAGEINALLEYERRLSSLEGEVNRRCSSSENAISNGDRKIGDLRSELKKDIDVEFNKATQLVTAKDNARGQELSSLRTSTEAKFIQLNKIYSADTPMICDIIGKLDKLQVAIRALQTSNETLKNDKLHPKHEGPVKKTPVRVVKCPSSLMELKHNQSGD